MTTKGKNKKSKKSRGVARAERRFLAVSVNNSWVVRILGMVGAATAGAGSYAYLYGESFKKAAEAARSAGDKIPPEALRLEAMPLYMIAFSTVLVGIAIWLGTSSEPAVRVGSAGIALERGELRRMPWSSINKITWDGSALTLNIDGADEASVPWSLAIPARGHRDAVGWILKEALDRIPKVVEIEDRTIDDLPGANPAAGTKTDLEPLQVVGRKDANTGELISYEPDARVCARCERIYHKRSVPKKCTCGAAMVDADPTSEAAEQTVSEASADAAEGV